MNRRTEHEDHTWQLLRLALFALLLFVALLLVAPAASAAGGVPQASVIQRGEYLVQLLGCGRCHTEGALTGEPTGPWLAGSNVGIAWTWSPPGEPPGVVFAPNLTPDDETGLGTWSERDIVRLLSTGIDHAGGAVSPVMPWAGYALLHDEDAAAIAAYLKSLPPVRHPVPDAVPRGQPSPWPYVRFSIHTFDGQHHEVRPAPAQ